MGGVDDNHVGPRLDEGCSSVHAVFRHTNGGPHEELTVFVFGCVWKLNRFFNIFNRDEAFEFPRLIDEGQFLDFMFLQDVFGFF